MVRSFLRAVKLYDLHPDTQAEWMMLIRYSDVKVLYVW
jgi:hypothetical protein